MECKIFYRSRTQFENLGDEIINKELIALMKSCAHVVIDSTDTPQWFLDAIGVKAEDVYKGSYFLFSMMKAAFCSKERVYFFTKPGHIEYSWGLKAWVSLLFSLFVYGAMYFSGVRICRFGGSLGRHDSISALLERIKGRFYWAYVVRDKESEINAGRLGCRLVSVAPDLAFLLSYAEVDNENCKGMVASFRDVNEDYFSAIKELLSYLDGRFEISGLIQVDRDSNFMNRLGFGACKSFLSEANRNRLNEIKDIYSANKFVISNRLHVLLLAMSRGALPLAVLEQSGGKIDTIFNEMGLGRAVIYLNKHNLKQQLEQALEFIDSPRSEAVIRAAYNTNRVLIKDKFVDMVK